MSDSRFFTRSAPISLAKIAELTSAQLINAANPQNMMVDVVALDRACAEDVSFLDNNKYVQSFADSKAGAAFVREKHINSAPQNMALLVNDDPYRAYALLAQYFYPFIPAIPDISPAAIIDETAKIGIGCSIAPGAVIGKNVEISERVTIGANAVIHDGVKIGADTRIGALSSISHAYVGQRVIIHRGVHIGQDGFGFAMGREGHLKVPQLGRVLIEDDVEIGAGTCIDRGTGPDTIIGAGAKIDNLVQIGHNVQIGKCAIVVAQTGIAGSTNIGNGAVLGGQVGIAGHLKIGAGARLAAKSGVLADIPPGATYGGSPAVPITDWHRQTIALARLTKPKRGNND